MFLRVPHLAACKIIRGKPHQKIKKITPSKNPALVVLKLKNINTPLKIVSLTVIHLTFNLILFYCIIYTKFYEFNTIKMNISFSFKCCVIHSLH